MNRAPPIVAWFSQSSTKHEQIRPCFAADSQSCLCWGNLSSTGVQTDGVSALPAPSTASVAAALVTPAAAAQQSPAPLQAHVPRPAQKVGCSPNATRPPNGHAPGTPARALSDPRTTSGRPFLGPVAWNRGTSNHEICKFGGDANPLLTFLLVQFLRLTATDRFLLCRTAVVRMVNCIHV